MSSESALIIFIKNPEKGKVKTRIAQTMGNDMALKIYEALLQHTRNIALGIHARRYLYYSHFIDHKDSWSREDFYKHLQDGPDLGARMELAFSNSFKQSAQKVIIIGSDCASLTPQIVQTAFEKLNQYPFVVGPALDGGYYLLGMDSFYPTVFQGMEWSTEQVLPATLAKIKALEKEVFLLPVLSDIDYEEDWKKYGWPLD